MGDIVQVIAKIVVFGYEFCVCKMQTEIMKSKENMPKKFTLAIRSHTYITNNKDILSTNTHTYV